MRTRQPAPESPRSTLEVLFGFSREESRHDDETLATMGRQIATRRRVVGAAGGLLSLVGFTTACGNPPDKAEQTNSGSGTTVVVTPPAATDGGTTVVVTPPAATDGGTTVVVTPPPVSDAGTPVNPDPDNDNVLGTADLCPNTPDPFNRDADDDGLGDACPDEPNTGDRCPHDSDNDIDHDGICGNVDNCPVPNPRQEDYDRDGVGDLCDNAPGIPNHEQNDLDGDGIGDVADQYPTCAANTPDVCGGSNDDFDGDGDPNNVDNCYRTPNADQMDTDLDGFGDACDCEPDDAGAYPGGTEHRCDGVDGNCDGTEQEMSVLMGDGSRPRLRMEAECECVEGDEFNVNPATGTLDNDPPGDCTPAHYVCANGLIVGPTNDFRGPAREICDPTPAVGSAHDENCNGATNEGCACEVGTSRACGSAEGECTLGTQTCGQDAAGVSRWGLCEGGRGPAEETCNLRDDDCDAVTDEGYNTGAPCRAPGECGMGVRECASLDSTVCSTAPGGSADASGEEICDAKDNDCDRFTDEGFDVGTECRALGDCGERSGGAKECLASGRGTRCSTAPGGSAGPAPVPAETCNLHDEDCDGSTDEGLGCSCVNGQTRPCGTDTGECVAGTQTCAGGLWAICAGSTPAAAETCNRLDDDCDTATDEGFPVGQRCDAPGICGQGVWECKPGDPSAVQCSTGPGGSSNRALPGDDLCDVGIQVDSNCNGSTNENVRTLGDACILPGVCGSGYKVCDAADPTGRSVRCSTSTLARTEVCDAEAHDEDCDGSNNEGCVCTPNTTRPCGTDVGECTAGTQRCTASAVWGACEGAVFPTAESCNGKNDDCDTNGAVPPAPLLELIDEDALPRADRASGFGVFGAACVGDGVCGVAGTFECADETHVRCSVSPLGSDDRSSEELCDTPGTDEDCDRSVNEGFSIGTECDPTGECGPGVLECAGIRTTRCSTGPGGTATGVRAEICNVLDDDCDGVTDEGLRKGEACDPPGTVCGPGVLECDGTAAGGTRCSTGPDGTASQAQVEVDGNGIDEDCVPAATD